MRIRTKLTLIIVGIFALLGAALAFYAFSMSRIERIESKRVALTRLADAVKTQAFAVDRLPLTTVRAGEEELAESAEAVAAALADASADAAALAGAGGKEVAQALAESLQVVKDLSVLNDKRMGTLLADYEALQAAAKPVFFFTDEMKPIQLFTYEFTPEKRSLAQDSIPALKTLLSDIEIAHSGLSALADYVAEQSSSIGEKLDELRRSTALWSILVAGAIAIVTFVLSMAFATSIFKSIVGIANSFARLRDGDLTERAVRTTRDEIGNLADDFNAIIGGFAGAIGKIKSVSSGNVAAKDELSRAAAEAAGSGVEIEANARSIERQVVALNESAEILEKSILKIGMTIREIDGEVSEEGVEVERATSSVTQMHASLASMAANTDRDRESAKLLVAEAERGESVFEDASAKIASVLESVSSIRDLAAVIQDIATRTNLLAMNAAIEAAHAGEFGGGFAVVADEIRNLSEASTDSSREIADSVKGIVERIGAATEANGEILRVFGSIDERIGALSLSLEELFAGIGEIRSASDEILAAMHALRERSSRLRAGSTSMSEGAGGVESAMEGLSRISGEVTSNISEITTGIADIHESIRLVAGLADRVGAESARLDAEVGRFKTSPEGEGEPEEEPVAVIAAAE